MIQAADFNITAWNHTVDFVVEPLPPEDPVAALKAAVRGEAPASLRVPLVFTGIYSGPVRLEVEVLDREPAAPAPGWEDVAEVSLVLPEGRAYFNQTTGSDTHGVGSVSAGEAGSYRARLHAAGRDTGFDITVDAPTERHLVQLWKAPYSPMAVHAVGSSAGKSWQGFMFMWLEDA